MHIHCRPLLTVDRGGTVLSTLLNTLDAAVKNASISVLARNSQQAQVLEEKGISTVQVGDYTDTTAIAELASDYDGRPALHH